MWRLFRRIEVENIWSIGEPLQKASMSSQTTTSEFMLLIRGTHWRKDLSPEEIEKVMNRWTAWFDRLTQEGKAKAGQPLAHEGSFPRVQGGDRRLYPVTRSRPG